MQGGGGHPRQAVQRLERARLGLRDPVVEIGEVVQGSGIDGIDHTD